MSAQGTRKLETTDRIDHKVREKKVIQLGGPQPESSNNPLFSGWACKPYLYIESSVLSQQQTSVLSQQKTSILSQQKTRQLPASGRLLLCLLLRQDRCLLLRQDRCLLLRQDRRLLLRHLSLLNKRQRSWLNVAPGCSWLPQADPDREIPDFDKLWLQKLKVFCSIPCVLQLYEELLKVTSIMTTF